MNLASGQQGKSLFVEELLRAWRGLINPCAWKSRFHASKNPMAIIIKAQCTARRSVIKTLRRPIKGGETFSGRGAIPHRR